MQFLKQKMVKIYTNVKEKLRPEGSQGAALIKAELAHPDQAVNLSSLEKLASLSTESGQYSEILKLLIEKLQNFQYKSRVMKTINKVISMLSFIVKNGSDNFSTDLRKYESLLIGLEKIDTHHFENTHTADKKLLEYNLEIIRQRATFIRRLINTPDLLYSERSKVKLQSRDSNKTLSESQTVNQLIVSRPMTQRSEKNFRIQDFKGKSERGAKERLEMKEIVPFSMDKKSENSSFV